MSKIESKKKQKKTALLQTAFELFTDKGFAKTTISDIANQAGLAKGTFYLYFKDKYDLRNKLTAYKAGQLFSAAHQSILEHPVTGLENQIVYFADFFIDSFEKDHALLQFISKNLSWGIFRTAFEQTVPEESQQFYDYFMEIIKKGSVSCEEPELMLFTIIELVGATCYNCILFGQPMSMEKYKPFLHETIHLIVKQYTQLPDIAESREY